MTPSTDDRPLFGLVLAGGESRRLGSDKAALRRGGTTQLEYLMMLMAAHTDQCFLSTRSAQEDDALRSPFAKIVDRYESMGPVAGILSALEQHPGSDWLVVACDLPNIEANTLSYLIDSYDGQHPFAAYRSTHDGLPEPLCAIYGRGSHAVIQGFVKEGLHCPRKILIKSATQLLEQQNPTSLENVNTPDDLRASVLRTSV